MATKVWRRRPASAFQNAGAGLVYPDPFLLARLEPGETVLRVRWEVHYGWRYFADVGPGFDAFLSFAAGAILLPETILTPTFGPLTNPNADWLNTRLLPLDPYNVPPTPGSSNFTDARYRSGDQGVDTEGQRRVPLSDTHNMWVIAEPAFSVGSWPLGAFFGRFYISTLVNVP